MKHLSLFIILLSLEAGAVEFEPLGAAIAKVLGTNKALKASVRVGKKAQDVFYSKDSSGQVVKTAVVQKGVYEPNCTHTWVIGLQPKTARVEGIRVVEMSCPHAFPTRKPSYLSQYMGKGPADLVTLSSSVQTIAKATGSSNLTTDAVKHAIETVAVFSKSRH